MDERTKFRKDNEKANFTKNYKEYEVVFFYYHSRPEWRRHIEKREDCFRPVGVASRGHGPHTCHIGRKRRGK